MSASPNLAVLPLSAGWVLSAVTPDKTVAQLRADVTQAQASQADVPRNLPFSIPGDVHSALLAAGHIEDPYYRDNEYAVDWINRCGWQIERDFIATEQMLQQHSSLVLENVDCVSSVFLNDQLIGTTDNQFARFVFPVAHVITVGENKLRIEFVVALEEAARRHQAYPFELPGESLNSRLPNNNFLRKTPCHSGWDWNICLMPIGVYGDVRLETHLQYRLDDVNVVKEFIGDNVKLRINLSIESHTVSQVECDIALGADKVVSRIQLYPGMQRVEIELDLVSPELWWPTGYGQQTRHTLDVKLDANVWSRKIGLCQTSIVRDVDTSGPGSGFRIDVNGQPLFMRGSNWIPADALPQRGTPEVVRELLESAVDANMNMIRVWGGGQYEADWFYELCDELGILVWQDFMFSCNHYPAADPDWITSVRKEATQQVRRLSRFACVALWCGDNELVGALKWWEITTQNRDRYLANYVRLNTALEEIVAAQAPLTPWWPSSPSQGLLDFSDGWKSDVAGDMHFWDVWHEAKPFSAYQQIKPRFCSEFGFQSFPSMPVISSFATPADQNVSSAVMEVHQRNVGGNARIVETLTRYFPFPDSFERTVFLSQCQQAMAITTGVEYWRSLKPHCMGTLYWQLNDTWPVASWSSLEYGGGWKLLHYAARRFYQPVVMMIVPVDRAIKGQREYGGDVLPDDAPLAVRAVNDRRSSVSLSWLIRAIDMNGHEQQRWAGQCVVDSLGAVQALDFRQGDIPQSCFLVLDWVDANGDSGPGENNGRTEYWPRAYKQYDLPNASVTASSVNEPDDVQKIVLNTDKPAFYVTVELGGKRIWSDNGFTLLPGEPKTLHVCRVLSNPRIPDVEELLIEHL